MWTSILQMFGKVLISGSLLCTFRKNCLINSLAGFEERLRGIVRFFHQENGKKLFLWFQFIKHKTFPQRCHFMKKTNKNNQILKILVVPILYPSEFNKSHLIFLCLVLFGAINMIFLYCVYSTSQIV